MYSLGCWPCKHISFFCDELGFTLKAPTKVRALVTGMVVWLR